MILFRLTDEAAAMLAKKARHGTPCTSCGLCCTATLCDLAATVFDKPKNAPGPCPALEWVDGKSSCGMLTDPTKFSARAYAVGHEIAVKAAALMVDPGFGCDMSMPGDRDDNYFFARNVYDAAPPRQRRLAWAQRIWGMRAWATKHRVRSWF